MQWAPKWALTEPFASGTRHSLSEETSLSCGNSPLFSKILAPEQLCVSLATVMGDGTVVVTHTEHRYNLEVNKDAHSSGCPQHAGTRCTKQDQGTAAPPFLPHRAGAGPSTLPQLLLQGFEQAEGPQLRVTHSKLADKSLLLEESTAGNVKGICY